MKQLPLLESLIKTIVNATEQLLNSKNATQLKPTTGVKHERKYLVAASNRKRMYECTVQGTHVVCECQCYKFNHLRKHGLSVAFSVGLINEHISTGLKRKRKTTCKTGLVPSKPAAGKKGATHKQPWRRSTSKFSVPTPINKK